MAEPKIRQDFNKVRGRCPNGCGETLFLGEGGYVTCSWRDCPNPTAAGDRLAHGRLTVEEGHRSRVAFTDDDAERLGAIATGLEQVLKAGGDPDDRDVSYLRRLASRCSEHQRSCVICGEHRVAGEPDRHLEGCPNGSPAGSEREES